MHTAICLVELPAITLVLARYALASLTVGAYLLLRGLSFKIEGVKYRHLIVFSLISVAIPGLTVTIGQLFVSSALAGVINGTPPVFVALLSHFLLDDEPITTRRIQGVALGGAGYCVLFIPPLLGAHQVISPLGVSLVGCCALSASLAVVYGRKHLSDVSPALLAFYQLAISTLLFIPICLLVDSPWQMAAPTLPTLTSLLALGIFGTAAVHILYCLTMVRHGANAVANAKFLLPVVSCLCGIVLLQESLSSTEGIACALLGCGAMLGAGRQ